MAGEILDGRLPERNCKRKAGKEHPDGDYEVLQLNLWSLYQTLGVIPNARVFTSGRRDLPKHGIRLSFKLLPPRLLIAL
jgi:hypothetical protein